MAETMLEGMPSRDVAGERIVVLPGVAEIGASLQKFQWPDYVMFSFMLLICMAIGLFFGFRKMSSTAQEYLMGGRNMKLLPIIISLIASFISGISILGIPTETYLYGIQYIYLLVGMFIMSAVMSQVYLPVFYNLKLTSTYEYLERRFDKRVRLLGSVLFAINMLTWLPIVIYVPALAFNQVTGVNVHLITPILCIICIFYTTLGGIKAVVWTDVIQAIIMLCAMLLVAIKGTLDAGGIETVLSRNLNSSRIEAPNLDFNLRSRYTFWSLTIGGFVYFLQTAAVNQNMIQRYLALPTITSAKRAVWAFCLGLAIIVLICSYTGILIYATYHQCDPLTTQLARQKDQLLPLLVMQVLGDYPGLPGIFVAGILSASLSSLSTGLNAMAAVVIEDFCHLFLKRKLTEKQSSIIMRLTVVIYGSICVALVYVIEHLGAVLQLTMSIGTIGSGPSLGMFSMGILLPWVNAKGAFIGGTASLAFMSWLCFKAQADIATGELMFPEKPLTTEGCHYHFTPPKAPPMRVNMNLTNTVHPDEQFIFHHISYMWYNLVGALLAMVIGLLTSFLTKPQDPRDLDPALLAPQIRGLISPRDFPNEPSEGLIYAYGTNGESKNKEILGLETLNKEQ